MCARGISRRRGSTLAAALALAFLIFVIASVSLARVTATFMQESLRHRQVSAMFIAEAGMQKAARELISNRSYTGERGTKLQTGRFDVSVTGSGSRYDVVSTGYVKSPFKKGSKKTVSATIVLSGSRSFRIVDWRENK